MEAAEQFRQLQDAAAEAMVAADYPSLRRFGREIAALGEAAGAPHMVAFAEYFSGIALVYNNEGSAGNRALRRALRYFRESGDRVMAARTMINLAMIEIDINLNGSEARRLYEEAAPVLVEEGDVRRLAILYGNLAEVCRLEGDYDAALRNGRESERLFHELDDPGHVMWQQVTAAHIYALRRDYPAAIASMRAAHERVLRGELSVHWIAMYFDMWVILAAKLERWETAAILLRFVDSLRSQGNAPRLQGMLPWLSSPMERLGSMIPQDRLHELFLEGESLTTAQAQTLVESIEP